MHKIYKQVYQQTKSISAQLLDYRREEL